MQHHVYSIYDNKASLFASPNLFQNDATACRAIRSFASQPGSTVYENPEDFVLYCLGTFDDNAGAFVSETPRLVASIEALKV